jgi:regulatory protein
MGWCMRRPRTPLRPLDETRLSELALAYVARFATSRAKLTAYCRRKLRERGWEGESQEDASLAIERIATRLVDLRYIDDAAFALQKSAALARRGLGKRRVTQALLAAGVGEADRSAAIMRAVSDRWDAALTHARRRKLGPYGDGANDFATRQRQLASLLRAGHDLDIARRIVSSRDLAALEAEAEGEAE